MSRTIDLTVDELVIPNTPGLEPAVGTFKPEGQYLTPQDVVNNQCLPYEKTKNHLIGESQKDTDFIINKLEYDATLLFRFSPESTTEFTTLHFPTVQDDGHHLIIINLTGKPLVLADDTPGLSAVDRTIETNTAAMFTQGWGRWIRLGNSVTTLVASKTSLKIPTEGAVKTALEEHRASAAGYGSTGHISVYVSGTTLYLTGGAASK